MLKAVFHRQTILAARWRLAQPRPPRAARLRSEPALPPRPTIDLARAVQSAEHTCDEAFDVLDGQPGSDRKSVGEGKSVSVRVDLGGSRILKKKTTKNNSNKPIRRVNR